MISEKLKNETSRFHSIAEQENYSTELVNGSITKVNYINILKRLYCFFSQAHQLSEFYTTDIIIPKSLLLEKIKLLTIDLSELDETIEPGHIIFDKLDYYNSLGFCYVSIGSILGGQYIYKSLLKMQLNETVQLPVHFYASCKPSAAVDWNEFLSHLNAFNGQHHESIINGAKMGYLYFYYLCNILK